MSVFFNGRLLITPTSASAVDDSAMANRNLTVGNNVAYLGLSSGGKPNTPLVFGSPAEAKAALKSGELLDAVVKAFDPSAQTGGPAQVTAIRVNPAVQSSLVLNDASSAAAINLVSQDYGLGANQIAIKVEAATTLGLKLSTRLGNAYFTQDNVYRNALQLSYTGGLASATVTINGTTLTLAAPAGTTVATIDLNSYPTVQQLVDRINVVSNFVASVQDGNGNAQALNGLDYVTAVDVKTAPYIVTAHLQAAVDWFNGNGESFVTATRATNAGKVPAPISYTYLAGGSDGVTTNTNWSDAFTTLQTVDVQWLTALSGNSSIWAMADAHATYMSNVGKRERRNISGMSAGSTDAQAIDAAKSLNSDRTSLVHLGYYDYDASGKLVLYPPYMLAALIAGAFAGVSPGTALTNKSLKVRGLERVLRNPTDTDSLILGGVLCVESTTTGFKVVQSIATWLTNDNYNRVEVSTGAAVDYAIRSVRDALDVLRGEKGNPLLLSRAKSIAESTLDALAVPDPNGPGVLVGDATNPPYKNLTVSLSGDVLRVELQASPVIPDNYVLTTVHAVPWSGTA